MRAKVAAQGHEPGQRRAPSGWFWSPSRDVCRDTVTGNSQAEMALVAHCIAYTYTPPLIALEPSVPVGMSICRRLETTARGGTAVTIGVDED